MIQERVKSERLVSHAMSELNKWARVMIFDSLGKQMTESDNVDEKISRQQHMIDFWMKPDATEHHEFKWHQWGIVTHTRKTWECFDEELWICLQNWGLDVMVMKMLMEKIDGLSKKTLFCLATILHDIGKFTVRRIKIKDGVWDHSFKGHDQASAELIKNSWLNVVLIKQYGLTEAQIEYVSLVAGRHFELGKLRKVAKDSPAGYNRKFLESDLCREVMREIIKSDERIAVEIGLFFVIDTLGKMEVRIEDENNQNEISRVRRALEKNNLHPNLLKAVRQMPVSLELARRYLLLLK